MITLTVYPLTILLIKFLLLIVYMKHVVAHILLRKDCYTMSIDIQCDWEPVQCYFMSIVLLGLMAGTVFFVALFGKLRRWSRLMMSAHHSQMLLRGTSQEWSRPPGLAYKFASCMQAAPSGWEVWRGIGVLCGGATPNSGIKYFLD